MSIALSKNNKPIYENFDYNTLVLINREIEQHSKAGTLLVEKEQAPTPDTLFVIEATEMDSQDTVTVFPLPTGVGTIVLKKDLDVKFDKVEPHQLGEISRPQEVSLQSKVYSGLTLNAIVNGCQINGQEIPLASIEEAEQFFQSAGLDYEFDENGNQYMVEFDNFIQTYPVSDVVLDDGREVALVILSGSEFDWELDRSPDLKKSRHASKDSGLSI